MVAMRTMGQWSMIACTTLAAAATVGCKTRAFNTSAVKETKTMDTTLVRTSDLPLDQYLEEAGDVARFKEPLYGAKRDDNDLRLNIDYTKDFALCSGYPWSACTVDDLKRGVAGAAYAPIANIDEQIVNIDEQIKSYIEQSKDPSITPDEKTLYEEQIKRFEQRKTNLQTARATAEAGYQAFYEKVKPMVEAEAAVIDGAVAEGFEFSNPYKYVTIYLKKAGREPKRFAAATVLKYMRVLRKMAFVFPDTNDLSPKGLERRKAFYRALNEWRLSPPADPSTLDASKMKKEELEQAKRDYAWYLKIKPQLENTSDDAPLNDQDWITDAGDNRLGNLGAAPPHWNDLQAHYYAATGHRRHGCYTLVHWAIRDIKEEAKLPELIKGEGKMKWVNVRDTALRFCMSESKTKGGAGKIIRDWAVDESKVRAAIDALKADQDSGTGVDELNVSQLEQAWGVRPFFRRMWNSQTVADLKGELNPFTKRPYNVFDYVMLAPVWAMNFDQQQAVINAFYHDLSNEYGDDGQPLEKPKAEPIPAYVPGSSMGCGTRPARAQVESVAKDVCSFDRVRNSPLHNVGR